MIDINAGDVCDYTDRNECAIDNGGCSDEASCTLTAGVVSSVPVELDLSATASSAAVSQLQHLSLYYIIIRPPVYGSNGRSYKMIVMFLFFSTRNLRAPSADHRETSPHDRNMCLLYKLTPKIRGALPPPKKNGGQKHAKFRSISYNLRL